MDNPTFLSAFIAGILTFLSPCILPLLPGYISFISGETLEELRKTERVSPRLKAVLGAVFFGLGFTVVFVLLGATATKIGQLLAEYKYMLARIAGVIILIFGLHMAGVFKINFLLKQTKVNYKKHKFPFFVEAFLLGVAFVLGWTPCVGPILSGILAIAALEDSIYKGMALLLTYSAGLWIPFLIAALAVGETMKAVRKAGKYIVWVERAAGILLIVIGAALITGSMTKITVFLLKIFPNMPVF